MKNLLKTHFFLLIIVVLAAFFRLYNLSLVPPGPSLDEVSIGYNAYSILKTGNDEYGVRMPLLLRAYDDYRPAIYVYLVIPFVRMFGLNILAVRLPSVILSILTVFATYFLVNELFYKNNKFKISGIAAFLLAVSPWHVYISRLGHEVNLGFSFLILAILFFFRYINRINSQKSSFNLFVSVIFFSISFSAYQSEKIVVPLIVLSLFILFAKKLLVNKTNLIIAGLLGLIFSLPMFVSSFKPEALIRFKGTNLFVASDLVRESADKLLIDYKNHNLIGILFHNRRFYYLLIFIKAFFSHLNPVWLFSNQGKEAFKVPGFGLFYIIDLPFLLLGLFIFFRNKYVDWGIKLFLVSWFTFSILPGAITTAYPHAMRIFTILPVPQIIEAFGIAYLFLIIKKLYFKAIRRFTLVVIYLAFILSAILFYRYYFFIFPKELSDQFQYGALQALSFAHENQEKYEKIMVSNKEKLFQSYMFYLYAAKFNPYEYQKMGGTKSGGFSQTHLIGKFEFSDPKYFKKNGNNLYIINPDEFSSLIMEHFKTVKFLDGTDAVWFAKPLNR